MAKKFFSQRTNDKYMVRTADLRQNLRMPMGDKFSFADFRDLALAQMNMSDLPSDVRDELKLKPYDLIANPVISYEETMVVVTDINSPDLDFLRGIMKSKLEITNHPLNKDYSLDLNDKEYGKLKESTGVYLISRDKFKLWHSNPFELENERLNLFKALLKNNLSELDNYYSFVRSHRRVKDLRGLFGVHVPEFEGLRFLRSERLDDSYSLLLGHPLVSPRTSRVLYVSNSIDSVIAEFSKKRKPILSKGISYEMNFSNEKNIPPNGKPMLDFDPNYLYDQIQKINSDPNLAQNDKAAKYAALFGKDFLK